MERNPSYKSNRRRIAFLCYVKQIYGGRKQSLGCAPSRGCYQERSEEVARGKTARSPSSEHYETSAKRKTGRFTTLLFPSKKQTEASRAIACSQSEKPTAQSKTALQLATASYAASLHSASGFSEETRRRAVSPANGCKTGACECSWAEGVSRQLSMSGAKAVIRSLGIQRKCPTSLVAFYRLIAARTLLYRILSLCRIY